MRGKIEILSTFYLMSNKRKYYRIEMSICGASEQLKNKAAQVCNVGREVIDLMS